MKNQIVIALMQLPGIGRKAVTDIIPLKADSPCEVEIIKECLYRGSQKSKRIKNFDDKTINASIEKSKRIIDDCGKLDIKVVTFLDEEYPRLLLDSNDYPSVLYYKGDISYLGEKKTVAIVGTREPSEYGYEFAKNLGKALAQRDIVDISGLAIGCDTAGHIGCLNASGKTIAVLAGGLDTIYPSENKELADRILDTNGALISEYPPYMKSFKSAFVERDRIQAGLSNAVIVVESKVNGGTMHAADYAVRYGRYLFAVNHPKECNSTERVAGNQLLIKEGKAIAINNIDDVEELIAKFENTSLKEENYNQMSIFDLMNK